METNKTKNTDLFLIDPRNIVVVDGFNVRRDFDLDELKEQIKAKGVLNPLTVIAFKDDEGNEKYKLVDGERRYRATMLAISALVIPVCLSLGLVLSLQLLLSACFLHGYT